MELNLQKAILDFATKQFIKELNKKGSDVNKQFQELLHGESEGEGKGKGGLYDTLLQQAKAELEKNKPLTDEEKKQLEEEAKKAAKQEARQEAKQKQLEKAELEKEIKGYKRTTGQAILDNVLQSTGTISKGAGKAFGAYNSLLGDALIAISNGITTPGYSNPLFMMPALAAGKKARGAIGNIAGDTAGTVFQDVGRDLRYNREKDKMTEMMLKHDLNGASIDALKQLTKQSAGSNNNDYASYDDKTGAMRK